MNNKDELKPLYKEPEEQKKGEAGKTKKELTGPEKVFSGVIMSFLALVAIAAILQHAGKQEPAAEPVRQLSYEDVKEFKAYAESFITEGIVYRYAHNGNLTTVYVTDAFMLLPYDQKKTACFIIMAANRPDPREAALLLLKDYRTDAVVGRASTDNGLHLK